MPDAGDPFFGTKLETWNFKMSDIFHLLQSDMVWEL